MSEGEASWRYLSSCEPLRVWFVWHPDNHEAAALAAAVASRLGPTGDPQRAGTGLPIYFATGVEDGGGPPPAVPLGDASDTVAVVPLICSRMVADARWRRWMRDLRYTEVDGRFEPRPHGALIVPVALDSHGYRMPAINDLGYVQIDPPRGSDRTDLAGFRADRLTRRLVVALTRRMLGDRRLTLFLSHAKADGRTIAATLRDRIVDYDQIDFFFDENDLPSGHPFDTALEHAISHKGSPAMLVVLTGHYAERPWCRRELARFRQPSGAADGRAIWHQRPMLVVDGLDDKPTRLLAETAGATVLRWRPGAAEDMLDALMREVLMSEYRQRRAERVMTAIEQAMGAAPDDLVVVDWVPEPYSIGWVRAQHPGLRSIVYPGDGLSRIDRDALEGAVPVGASPEAPRLFTFGEMLHGRSEALAERPEASLRVPARTVLALSAGMPQAHERLRLGLGESVVYAILVRLCSRLLMAGYDLSYGGRQSHSFTRALSALVRSEEPVIYDRAAREGQDPCALPTRPMLINHIAQRSPPPPEQVARDLGLVRYVPLPDGFAVPPGASDALKLALRITEMRRGMHAETTALDGEAVARPIARLVLGGKANGFSGFASGVAEETARAMSAGVPVYVMGLLGGGAEQVGRAVLDGDADAARSLTSSCKRALEAASVGRSGVAEETRRHVGGLLDRRDALTANGLTREENRELFETNNLDNALRLITKGLRALGADQS